MDIFVYVCCVNFECNDWFLVLCDMVYYYVFYFFYLKSCEGEVIWVFGLVIGDW